jgi:hypothetical protein
MRNPFLEFKNVNLGGKEIPLERFVHKNRQVMADLRAAFHGLSGDQVKELCRLLDHGRRLNVYKSMLLGIDLPELLKSTLIQAAVVYQSSLQLIRTIEYAPGDIEEYCAMNELSKDAGFEQTGPVGIFLSALINASKERYFVLHSHNPHRRLHFLGFRLEEGKCLTVHGDVGHFTGAGLSGGLLRVNGSTGSWCGADMTGGRLEITGDALARTGVWMKGGQIQVKGRIHQIATQRTGGEIQCRQDE